ncbi:MAG: hypothetical protein AVDCRST_MAG20-1902 [uncultured Acidimicrobiales bacterium]|uniref:SLH domain-containing protein n=1 Tax=uncultured Acidimicrobiales bacterium TaxID=310071 RepID=A0A6J4I7H1_9ACTN|nr:MAG: hypothetical protein AVDCRST_MAG20-1902 [uncultured Acidimicrobiales bacterium]
MLSWRTTGVPILALLAVALPVRGATAGAADASAEPVVVRFDGDVQPSQQDDVLADAGYTLVDRLPGSDFALAVPDGGAQDPSPLIDDVEATVAYRAFGVPDDPAYRFQWHLPAIGAASAHDVTKGAGTIVAIIDSGVAYETSGPYVQAPDLAGTRFVPGWDFVDGDAHANDENGHGTHVTGSVAQTTGNGLGAAGVAPSTSIMPLRVLDAAGSGTDFAVAQAIRFAADNGATVANLSLGGQGSSSVMRDAIRYATGKGTVVVAAAGNDGLGVVSYPAAEPEVIAVGAVRFDRTRPAYGNYGSALDIVAPGGDSSVDQNRDSYGDGILQQTFQAGFSDFCLCFMQGTSMATPQVSAVAALVASRGVSDRADIERIVLESASDLGPPGWDQQYGNGLVQAGAAVRAPLPSQPPPAEPPPVEPSPVDPPSEPVTTDPPPTTPGPTDPPPSQPGPTQPVTGGGTPRGIELACPPDDTPASPFTDLAGSVHVPGITCAAWWGVANGRTATTFEPSGPVTRAQLASFVARTLEASGLELPISPPDAFADDGGSVHQPRINQLAALRVVQGRTDGTFAPEAVVTRAEMATFLVRAHDVLAAAPLPAGPDRFVDDDASVHVGNIDKIAAAGLAGGTSATTYAPTAAVQRGQMTTFLSRTIDLFVADGDTAPR